MKMNGNIRVILAVASVIIIVGATYAFLSYPQKTQDLSVFSADAYVPEANALLGAFHNHTGIGYYPVRGGGSFTDARQIALGSPASLFISVSLESYQKSFLANYSSGWALAFASDQMVIAYSNASLGNSYSSELISDFNGGTPSNNTTLLSEGFSILSSGHVKVGISNPQSDPAGVRGWLTLEMAGFLYHGKNSSYYTGMMVNNRGNYTSSSAAELVSPLTLGQIQFLFIYKSAAITHHLQYVSLPAAVNQGDANLSGFYHAFSYGVAGNPVYGSPILLFVSLVSNGTYQEGAEMFLSFLLNNTEVISGYGLTILEPMLLYGNASSVPAVKWGVAASVIKQESPAL